MGYRDADVRGIGGWLAFFVVTLLLGAGLGLIVTISTVLGLGASSPPPGVTVGAWDAYIAGTVAIGLAGSGGLAWIAWLLNARQQPATPRRVRRWLWPIVLLAPIADGIMGSALLGLDATQAGQVTGAHLLRPIVYAIVWTLYLARSRRVANTYGTGASDEALAAVFD